MHRRVTAGKTSTGVEKSSRRRRWLRAAAWLTALLLAVTASVVALSRRAQAVEPQPYQPSAELEGALQLAPDTERGGSLYHWHCTTCHGKEGWGSTDGRTPVLAGQHYQYLVKQIADLRRGQDRENAAFHIVALRALRGNQAIANVAAYVSGMEPNRHPRVGAGEQLRLGGKLYDWLCRGCHQDSGEGYAIFFIPSISSQHYDYLLQQLDDFATGHRVNAPLEVLDLAVMLSEEQRAAVADYVSRLGPPETMGGAVDSSRIVENPDAVPTPQD
jgi:cytochrome c553